MFITNDIRDDGFGAQYQSIIWSILFAEVKGHTFFYSDIKYMNNGVDNDKKFIEDAVRLMNIKQNYPDVYSVYRFKEHTVYALKAPLFFKEIENNMEHFHNSDSFQRVKGLFYQNKESPFDNEHIHIAVHIRKPVKYDVFIENNRLIKDDYFIGCMNKLLERYKSASKTVLFHIYSQGNIEDFEVYKEFPVKFHLEDDTFTSFIGMVFADVLVISPSSMSYTAGLLSNGEVIYTPFWHPPRKNWLVLE